MTSPCDRRNPLVRAGLSQDGRRRLELGRHYFAPDERDVADLILFGQRFAAHVRYYDPTNGADGTWSEFFESDESAVLAALAKLPVDAARGFQRDLEQWLRADPARDPAELADHAQLLFRLPIALLRVAGAHHARLPGNHELTTAATRLVASDLDDPLTRLVSWYKGALDPAIGLLADDPLDVARYNLGGAAGDRRVRLSQTIASFLVPGTRLSELTPGEALLSEMLHGAVILDAVPREERTWTRWYDAVPADPLPYSDAGPLPYHQVYDALTYNLLGTTIERIYQAAERLRREAVDHLRLSLESFAGHAPHYALWLTFLRLFDHARGMLNEFTGRHLDFYFREVLRLPLRSATPDTAHVRFELSRGTEIHLLPKGTAFQAGKDGSGRALLYELDDDLVVNRATVAELRGIRIEGGGEPAQALQRPRASSVVRSLDGSGAEALPRDDPAWPPFGPRRSPPARVGFAVADRQLFLREGRRTIVLEADLTSVVSGGLSPRWVVRLTGAKGWVEFRDSDRVRTRLLATGGDEPSEDPPSGERGRRPVEGTPRSRTVLEITVDLEPDDPAIVPADVRLHGSDHPAGLPVMEVLFDTTANEGAHAFAVLRDARARVVTVRTMASGLKDVMVVAGGASADASRPFTPFGIQPAGNADFIVGSPEIFSKRVRAWGLTVEWKAPDPAKHFSPALASHIYSVSESVLGQGEWLHVSGNTSLHFGTRQFLPMNGASLIDTRTPQTVKNAPFDTRAINGFARLRLSITPRQRPAPRRPEFGGLAEVADAQILAFALQASQGPPPESYTPVIVHLEASYDTMAVPVERVSTLHPFGVTPGGVTPRLAPEMPFEGALYVGIADLAPPARLTMLVQVLDGSGDPLRAAPPLHFAWLQGDQWTEFDAQDVDDKTHGFTTSGVLGLNVPREADTSHGSLPPARHWIRISTARDAAAFNRLLTIEAQAGRATFADRGNDLSFLAAPLPAGRITKLAVPDPAIKKVLQPYPSVGGRPPESDAAFDSRVSERLRHKDRAITMFDYETLVLEAFPQLFRARCLGTTRLMRDPSNAIVADNEVMPGAVTVVTVPWTHGRNARNPLRPYTDQATLGAVERFLRRRVTPFVRLEVQNPKFEEVHLRFSVRFRPDIGDIAFYVDALNEALVRFLTPWSVAGGSGIAFGGTLFKSSVIDFIEEQPSVDFVTDVLMFHKVDADATDDAWSPIDVDTIEATTARSILVSAPRHRIDEYADA